MMMNFVGTYKDNQRAFGILCVPIPHAKVTLDKKIWRLKAAKSKLKDSTNVKMTSTGIRCICRLRFGSRLFVLE